MQMCSVREKPSIPPFASMEAIAAITDPGFKVMGLRRMESGQICPALSKWNQMLEIFGYRTEGFRRKAHPRGQSISDVVLLACLYENYEKFSSQRGGNFWPSAGEISLLVRNLPKESYADRLASMIRDLENLVF